MFLQSLILSGQQPVDVSTTVSMLASVLGRSGAKTFVAGKPFALLLFLGSFFGAFCFYDRLRNTALHYETDGRRVSTTAP